MNDRSGNAISTSKRFLQLARLSGPHTLFPDAIARACREASKGYRSFTGSRVFMEATRIRPTRETLNIEIVAGMLGISRPVAYALAREDRLPVPTIKIGRRMVVSRRAVEELLNRTHADGHDTAA